MKNRVPGDLCLKKGHDVTVYSRDLILNYHTYLTLKMLGPPLV
jgi:hypothetical protein